MVDDDLWWPRGHIHKALNILESRPDIDAVVGRYSLRSSEVMPNYWTFGDTDEFVMPEIRDCPEYCRGYAISAPDPDRVYIATDYSEDELTRLSLFELGWLILRPELLLRLGDEPFNQMRIADEFPTFAYTRDTRELLSECESFAVRAGRAGATVVTQGDLICGHVDLELGYTYFPCIKPRLANGLSVPTQDAPTDDDGRDRHYYSWTGGENTWKQGIPNFTKAVAA